MVSKGNKDGHNYDYGHVSGVKIQETEKWGRSAAERRYGKPQYLDGAPSPRSKAAPQFPEDKRGPNYSNEVPVSSWLRGGGGSGKPVRGRK
jgi:hypothetical protein